MTSVPIPQDTPYDQATYPAGNPPQYNSPVACPYPVPQQGFNHPGYPPQHSVPQGHPQVQIVAPPATICSPVGPQPARMNCNSCHSQIISRTESESSSKTHLIACLLCCIGCWPCCLIPYCVDDCMNTTHYCPNCNAYLGRHEFK